MMFYADFSKKLSFLLQALSLNFSKQWLYCRAITECNTLYGGSTVEPKLPRSPLVRQRDSSL